MASPGWQCFGLGFSKKKKKKGSYWGILPFVISIQVSSSISDSELLTSYLDLFTIFSLSLESHPFVPITSKLLLHNDRSSSIGSWGLSSMASFSKPLTSKSVLESAWEIILNQSEDL